MRIPKGFKSSVLYVRILKGLQTHFSEVRILQELEGNVGTLNVERLERREKAREWWSEGNGIVRRGVDGERTAYVTILVTRCQDVFTVKYSNRCGKGFEW